MFRRILKGTLCLVALMAGNRSMASCADNHESIFIQQVQQITQPDCGAKSDPTANFLTVGSLDVAFGLEYPAAVLVASQLLSRGDPERSHDESNTVQLTGADVHLTGPGVDESYSQLISGVVYPTTSTTPAYGITSVNLIPATIGQKLATQLSASRSSVTLAATFKVYGYTLGNTYVESGTYTFVINVFYGNVIFGFDPTTGARSCPMTPPTGLTVADACNTGQDSTGTYCAYCAGNPICAP